MSRLLHAGIYRLRKSKALWGSFIVTIGYCLFVYISQSINMKKNGSDYYLDPLFFNFLIFSGIITATLVSLFVGTEYHDGTIRNKIISGLSRSHIYLSNFVLSGLAGTAILLVGYLVGLAVGIPLFGMFKAPIPTLFPELLITLLFVWAYVSIFTMITMISSSRTTSAILCLLLAFGMMVAALSIYSALSQPEYIQQVVASGNSAVVSSDAELEWVKNPYYLSGIKRAIYQNLLDFLPSGQMMQITGESIVHPVSMPLYSLLIMIATNAAGLLVFNRKNIK